MRKTILRFNYFGDNKNMKQNHKNMKTKTNFTLSFLKTRERSKKQENRFEGIRSTEMNAVATFLFVCYKSHCYKLIAADLFRLRYIVKRKSIVICCIVNIY